MTNEIVEAPEDVPPHLADLNDMQRSFVRNFVTNGGKKGKAARGAGYAESCAGPMASRMLHNPVITQAIMAEAVTHLGTLVPAAIGKVAQLSLRAKSEYVQLTASQDILDRAGFTAPKRVDVSGALSVTIDLS